MLSILLTLAAVASPGADALADALARVERVRAVAPGPARVVLVGDTPVEGLAEQLGQEALVRVADVSDLAGLGMHLAGDPEPVCVIGLWSRPDGSWAVLPGRRCGAEPAAVLSPPPAARRGGRVALNVTAAVGGAAVAAGIVYAIASSEPAPEEEEPQRTGPITPFSGILTTTRVTVRFR